MCVWMCAWMCVCVRVYITRCTFWLIEEEEFLSDFNKPRGIIARGIWEKKVFAVALLTPMVCVCMANSAMNDISNLFVRIWK